MNQPKLVWVLLAPIVLMFLSCQPAADSGQAAAVDTDAVKAQIEAMEAAYAVASNAKDVDGVVAYYASDAQSLAENEPTRVGMDAIKAGIKKDMDADTTGHTISFAVTGVWAGGDYATETGTSTVKDKDGNVVETGKYMTLFELRDGKYVAIRDIWNSDAPSK
jgi:ketosteroid isomerase-like protein